MKESKKEILNDFITVFDNINVKVNVAVYFIKKSRWGPGFQKRFEYVTRY